MSPQKVFDPFFNFNQEVVQNFDYNFNQEIDSNVKNKKIETFDYFEYKNDEIVYEEEFVKEPEPLQEF